MPYESTEDRDAYVEALEAERRIVKGYHPVDADRLKSVEAELKAYGAEPSRPARQRRTRRAAAAPGETAATIPGETVTQHGSDDASGDGAPEPTGAADDPGSV